MKINEFKSITIVTADEGKYLKLKNKEESESIIGKPMRLILSNKGDIPEFEEASLYEVEE